MTVNSAIPAAEKLLGGEPRVVIRHGELLADNLRRDRLTEDEIESEMRLAGYARIKDVAWAILETNGKISFIAPDGASGGAQDRDDPAL